jgi:hypothetical protein
MDPWATLLARAQDERRLAAEGRWDELAASTAERVRLAAALGPAPHGARLVLEALAVVQDELTATIAAARDETRRELAGLDTSRGTVAGYAAAQSARTRMSQVLREGSAAGILPQMPLMRSRRALISASCVPPSFHSRSLVSRRSRRLAVRM